MYLITKWQPIGCRLVNEPNILARLNSLAFRWSPLRSRQQQQQQQRPRQG